MTTVSERLAALKKKLDAGRTDNLKAVQQEVSRAAEAGSDEPDASRRSGIDVTHAPTHARTHEEGKGTKRKMRECKQVEHVEGADNEADGEDTDDRIRGMKRRTRAVMDTLCRKADVSEEGNGHANGHANGHGKDNVLVYGGAANVNKDALDNMVNELQQVESRRAKFRRRRKFDEENDDISFINEGNRLFNRTLDRHFNKFDSVKEIQDNLERGTA